MYICITCLCIKSTLKFKENEKKKNLFKTQNPIISSQVTTHLMYIRPTKKLHFHEENETK